MNSMFWFFVHFTISAVALTVDALLLMEVLRLTRRILWRVLAGVFIGVQLAIFVPLALDWNGKGYLPKPILVPVVVWHYFGFLVVIPLVATQTLGWWRARRSKLPGPNAAAPPVENGLTRREFLGAYAAVAPPLLTATLGGAALWQIEHFRVRQVTLSVPDLPRALDGMTIAHVTDMHVGPWTRGPVLQEMVGAVNALDADMVLLTGDLIHFALSDLPNAISLVKSMKGRSGVWMIEGNHDLFQNKPKFRQQVKDSGVPLLVNEASTATVRGHPVQILGLEWIECPDRQRDPLTSLRLRELLKQRQPGAFPILLAHHPHAFDAAAAAGLPLTLSGHTHGGQLMIDRNWGIGPVFFRYWSGVYQKGGSHLVVSNGVGNVFPLRVNAPAEIIHLTLRGA